MAAFFAEKFSPIKDGSQDGKLVLVLFMTALIAGGLLRLEANLKVEVKGVPSVNDMNRGRKHIVLLGASVGRAWYLSSFPQRVGDYRYSFEYVHGGSSFDKSRVLSEILERKEKRPDAIFLKECAAYFPGDMEKYRKLIVRWVQECRDKGVIPIPTTVVPVTKFHAVKKFGIDILKLRNPLRYGIPFRQKRHKAILEYNDWVRAYCRENELVVLDLEAGVRYSESKRFLRSDLARMDGLHLKTKAYAFLDPLVLPALDKVGWKEK